MVFEDFERIKIDVLPGVALPAPAADFIFSRVAWIRAGEKEPFDNEAPAPFEFHDLATLAYLIATEETFAAGVMVSSLLRPPSALLPSATLPYPNDNFMKSNPFRRRKRGRFSKGPVDNAIPQVKIISCYFRSYLNTKYFHK